MGIPAVIHDGHERNLDNLCAWHAFSEFLVRRPDVAAVYREIEHVTEALREIYIEKTAFHLDLIRQTIRAGRRWRPGLRWVERMTGGPFVPNRFSVALSSSKMHLDGS